VDELHGVEVDAFRLAHPEDRYDVRVVQVGGGLRLPLEPLALLLRHGAADREHLQGDVPAQRLLHGLVDHPHAAAAHLAQDAVLAQPLGDVSRVRPEVGVRTVDRPEFLHHRQGREQIADLVGQFGVALGVLGG
jgi:hypothetical protein